jgi:P-type E1-E2 ATPase
MKIKIPGKGEKEIHHVLLDYNGTIACDGQLIPIVVKKIQDIHKMGIKVHVLTADTHGNAMAQCEHLPVAMRIFDRSDAAKNKAEIAEKLGGENCLCVGNGYNDGQMFEACGLAVAVIGEEGCAVQSLIKADLVCMSIKDAFNLILKPKRMIASLRG